MRLGGNLFEPCTTPEAWVADARRSGYTTVYWPLDAKAGDDAVRSFAEAARRADLVIAEVGAWANNPIDPDASRREAGIAACSERLATADRVGARCCVNVAGSRGPSWFGPHADNFSRQTFDLVVESVRRIIDAVKPTRTFYSLGCMEWVPPYTTENYLDLIRAVDRKAFAVHFDPVNLIWSPERYYRSGEIIREFVARLGPLIRSCHAKDLLLTDELTVHLKEVRPGLGGLDYRTYLRELARLDADLPLLLEHLATAQEFVEAAAYIRSVAREVGAAID